jgi:hypothetical protein
MAKLFTRGRRIASLDYEDEPVNETDDEFGTDHEVPTIHAMPKDPRQARSGVRRRRQN